MKKGFTLLELMIVLGLISSLLLAVSPVWQTQGREQMLMKEQQKLMVFLRQLQARAKNSPHIWFLIANRHPLQDRWCLTAQIKSAQLCDCFAPEHCPTSLAAQFYYPHFPQHVKLSSKRYLPFEITRFSGVRDTLSTACFSLFSEQEKVVFTLFNVGSMKVKRNQSWSACENE
ncbi:prepilin-type N-terminal cleavage/methylation domain-containing protein [Pasteurella sp. PK-2025]|uniref:prepilin-type N-terminal cleavage/methylation domain-containing protein n=1 Tax=unclassified Pasteurella TaxID=2621516 RepID=UPI003C78600A